MREQLPQFGGLRLRLACVVQGDAAETARFCGRHGLTDMCIPDPEKASYRAMGFPRTKWSELVFASKQLRERRAEAAAAGCSVNLSGAFQSHSDWLQLPGAALVAGGAAPQGGRILWLHRGRDVADLPPAPELLAIARSRLP